MNNEYKTPVLLLTYRKTEFLPEIFEMIARYKPSKLYISVNNYNGLGDYFDVKKVKKIIKKIHFPFETELISHPKHLKINTVFQQTLDYVFTKEKSLIILEDDVVPSLSFFDFCETMLARYQNNSEIGCINGCNLNAVNEKSTFFLSGISFPYWGWATWKEKWELYRADNFYWNNHRNQILNQISEPQRNFFTACFDANSQNFNVWDVQWNLSLLANGQKTILPSANLTTNKGFSKKATTTLDKSIIFGNLVTTEIITDIYLESQNKSSFFKYENRVVQFVEELTRFRKKHNI